MIANVLKILGLLMMGYSLTMLPPILVSLWYHEPTGDIFFGSFILTLILGVTLWFPNRKIAREVKPREGFLIVTLSWILISFVGLIPFIASPDPVFSLPFLDALFETISGITTTGATVLIGLDTLPRSIMYYRMQLHFVGGGGIILLGIAIMPMLGVGGMQLFRADIPGPFKEEKLTPRITQTAKALWLLYVGLVILCAISYWSAGMGIFDAITHSFSTISTGGFSTHDKSFAYFRNPIIDWVCILFMLLGAINFALHFTALHRGTLLHYWQDSELKTFLILLLIATLLVFFVLLRAALFASPNLTFLESIFQVVAFSTTTGFSTTDYSRWPTFLPIFLVIISMIGGCAGSTAGGIKIIRTILLNKQVFREIHRLIHPNGHYLIKVGNTSLPYRTLDAVWGFLGLYILAFFILLLGLLATGLDFLTAFSALAACFSNTGIGLGQVTDNFEPISNSAKIILSAAMLLGRLEFFTVLVLFTPIYWSH